MGSPEVAIATVVFVGWGVFARVTRPGVSVIDGMIVTLTGVEVPHPANINVTNDILIIRWNNLGRFIFCSFSLSTGLQAPSAWRITRTHDALTYTLGARISTMF